MFYVGMGFLALTAYSVMSWVPTAMMRRFDAPISEIGFMYGIVILLVTPWATPLGGAITDRYVARANYKIFLHLPILCAVGIVVAMLAFGQSASLPLALLTLAAFNLFYYASQAPAAGFTLHLVPGSMRGLVSALYVLLINLIGLTLGPPLVAIVSQMLDPLGRSLALALGLVCATSAALGALCLRASRIPAYRLFQASHSPAPQVTLTGPPAAALTKLP